MPAGVLTESAAAAANKKGSVEETYQKLTQHQVGITLSHRSVAPTLTLRHA